MDVLRAQFGLAAPPERAVFGRFSRLGFALLLFAGFTAVGLLEAFQIQVTAALSDRPVEWTRALTSTVPAWHTKLILLPAVLWLARRFPFSRERWQRSLAVHLPASLLHSFVYLALASYLCDYLLGPADFPYPYLANLRRLVLVYSVVELSYYWGVVGAYHAWDYYRMFREREREATELALRTSRLEGSLARANLDALRMQLHPHFLFNTLNAISALIHRDVEAADRMIARLGDLLRLALSNSEPTWTLRDEMDFVERYLGIEQVRFGDRLRVDLDVDPEALDAEVPSLILQPLVENAIKHGISRRLGRGRICVRAEVRESEGILDLAVRDDGPGFGQGSEPGTGVGLANTRARLEQLYGAAASLEAADAQGGGAELRVRLPLVLVAPAAEVELPSYETVGA